MNQGIPPQEVTRIVRVLTFLTILVGIGCGKQPSSQMPLIEVERPDFTAHFDRAGVEGTFVLLDPILNQVAVHNPARAKQRFIPASTFKILNSLIALETGVVADTSSVFVWDGTQRSIAQWNRDHTLKSAIKYSVVWAYQQIARDVGEQRMNEYIQKVGFGNEDIGGGIDQFWLSGDLRVSALEQVQFLQRLHERALPFSARSLDLVEDILIEEQRDEIVLRGKSGLATGDSVDVGWYVGYVTKAGRPYYFALQMDVRNSQDIALRRGIARDILTEMGLL